MDDIRRSELRDQLIAALMTAEDYTFDAAAKIVAEFAEFERTQKCPRCGAVLSDRADDELAGTIWDGWMSRGA